MKNIPENLSRISLFQGLNNGEIAEALELLEGVSRRYLTDEIILMAGDRPTRAGALIEGSVHVISEDVFGNRDILGSMSAPGLFADALCLSGKKSLPVSVVAREDCHVILLKLGKLLTDEQTALKTKLLTNLISEISEKVFGLTNTLRITSRRTTREKLLAYLRSESTRFESPEFEIPYTRQELADFLGVERSAMITELGKLKAAGLIAVKGRHFRLLGPAGDSV